MWFHFKKYPEDDLLTCVVHALPLRIPSRIWGMVHEIPLPSWIGVPLFQWWTKTFGCKLDEMKYPLEHYKNLAEFFSRPLKEGLRPIADSEIVSPCDAKVTRFGTVTADGVLEQIKGSNYELSDLLRTSVPKVKDNHELYYCILYLAPGDYHRIHSSCQFAIKSRLHVPGKKLFLFVKYL